MRRINQRQKVQQLKAIFIFGIFLFFIDKAIALSSYQQIASLGNSHGSAVKISSNNTPASQDNSAKSQNTASQSTTNPSSADDLDVLMANTPIIYGPKSNPKGVITVFTDIDCSYCRKLHFEINQLSKLGIQVRYLAFPRQGIGSSSYNKLVSVWCSSNPEETMNEAMQGQSITSKTCTNPVREHVLLGRKIGIMGTPTIIFSDGTMWPGYAKADNIAREAIMQNKSNGNSASENGNTGSETKAIGNTGKMTTGSAKSPIKGR